jgi:SAM-dependent methyltransferase
VTGAARFLSQKRDLARQFESSESSQADFPWGKLRPCLSEQRDDSGAASGHYFHQDLHVAQQIFQQNPARHVDVGSRIDGFVAHVATFRSIEVFDIRPLDASIANVQFRQVDLMATPPVQFQNYCDSLSCLHTLEHFGLGRYGDSLDPDGHLAGLRNLASVLMPGGTLWLSIPIGPQRIEFNAHRVFRLSYLQEMFEPTFAVAKFCYVNDQGDLRRDVVWDDSVIQCNAGCHYGCGIFELRKH